MRSILAATLLIPALACAASIVPVGVLGNSGEAGDSLYLADGTRQLNSGALLDSSSALWLSGGNAIQRVGLDGRVLERFAIEPAGAVVDSTAFASLGGQLYFLGRLQSRRAVFRLPMARGAVAREIASQAVASIGARDSLRLGAQVLHDKLLLAYEMPRPDGKFIAVATLDPDRGKLEPVAAVPGEAPESVVFDAARAMMVVGGRVVRGQSTYSSGVVMLRETSGTFVPISTLPSVPLPATPSWLNARVSLACGALWDVSGPYGFVARLRPDFSRAPGVIARWMHELDQTTQIVGLCDGAAAAAQPLLFATNSPAAYYLAEWDASASEFRITTRIGSLPDVVSLALSPGGWISVGAGRKQLWWRWQDDTGAAPRMADLSVAIGSGFFVAERFVAFGAVQRSSDSDAKPSVPLVFSSKRGEPNLAARPTGGEALPGISRPIAAALAEAGERDGTLLILDAATKSLYRVRVALLDIKLDHNVQRVAIDASLVAPTDLVTLGSQRIAIADRGRVLVFIRDGDGYRMEWSWENVPADRLGDVLHIASDGDALLVSDRDRHRLLWLDWTRRLVVAQYGGVGMIGRDLLPLHSPTYVAVRASRAIVADAGNQRIIKLELRR